MSKQVERRGRRFTFERRASGLLLHPTSLPGQYGSGDLGREAHAFVNFLAAAGQKWWQMLPVGPPGEGHSPYSAASAFAGHPALVSPDVLVQRGLLKRKDVKPPRWRTASRVEHDRVLAFRTLLLRRAFETFRARRGDRSAAFERFVMENCFWLEDYVLFAALKDATGNAPWAQWEPGLRLRDPRALAEVRRSLADEVLFQQFVQFEFDRQWQALRERCAKDGIGLIGDVPIFVAYDSAEVWANPHLFVLDRAGRPKVVSGCPPDFFNANGQRWGHPHYAWAAHAKQGFRWWVERFRQTLRWFDAVRIDHFLGFHRVWSIPANSPTAKRGRYTPGPADAFFEALQEQLGDVPIIAEDLGAVVPEALALRDRFDFPGMRVLQFGFGDGGGYHLPHNYPRRTVAYTGTHDNDTTAGWFQSIPVRERRRVLAYTGQNGTGDPGGVTWSLIRAALASVADTAIFPAQDLLGLGSESRMNVPGEATGNWGWRLPARGLTPALAKRLRGMCELYERA
jgi:4-alpha-glucanotransferase